MPRARLPISTLVAILGVAAITACDDGAPDASGTTSSAPPPAWLAPTCQPAPPRSVPSLPANPYWQCDVRQFLARSEDEWRRGGAAPGLSLWGFDDAAQWERFQESVAAALDAVAVPLRCTRPVPEERRLWHVDRHARFWAIPMEHRWVYMHGFTGQRWDQPFMGIVSVRTGAGRIDECADSLRLKPMIM